MHYRALAAIFLIIISAAPAQYVPYKDASLGVEERVEDLLSRMTLREKFWQLFMIPGDLSDGTERYADGIFGFQVATAGRQASAAEQMMDYAGKGTAFEMAETINDIQKFFVEETRLGIPIIAFDLKLMAVKGQAQERMGI